MKILLLLLLYLKLIFISVAELYLNQTFIFIFCSYSKIKNDIINLLLGKDFREHN